MTPELVERVARALCTNFDEDWSDPDCRESWVEAATAALEASGIVQARGALERIAAGRTIRFTGSEHHNKPLRDKDAQHIARQALSALGTTTPKIGG